jgi:hypothetical protein
MAMAATRPVRWPWKVLALVVMAIGVSVAMMRLGTCPDPLTTAHVEIPGDCQISYAGGPVGWVLIGVCVVVLIVSLKQAYGRPGEQFP